MVCVAALSAGSGKPDEPATRHLDKLRQSQQPVSQPDAGFRMSQRYRSGCGCRARSTSQASTLIM